MKKLLLERLRITSGHLLLPNSYSNTIPILSEVKVIQLIWHTIGWLEAVFTHKKSLICLCRLQQGRHFAHLIFPPFFSSRLQRRIFNLMYLFHSNTMTDRQIMESRYVHCKAIYFFLENQIWMVKFLQLFNYCLGKENGWKEGGIKSAAI